MEYLEKMSLIYESKLENCKPGSGLTSWNVIWMWEELTCATAWLMV